MIRKLLQKILWRVMDHAPYPIFLMHAKFYAPDYNVPRIYPGWHFGIAEKEANESTQRRLEIWRRWAIRFPHKPLKIPWHRNLKLLTWMGNDMSRCTYVGGAYEPNEIHFIDRFLQPGMQFLDIGANEGIYSILAAARVGSAGKVWAIEPSSREFDRLQQNIAANHFQQVKCHRIALSDHAGMASLKIAESEHAGQNTLGEFIYQIKSDGIEQVELTTLDLLSGGGADIQPDLIKMDVEGLEFRVLKGAFEILARVRPVIMFEQQISQMQLPQEMSELWHNLNYEIFHFTPDGKIVDALPSSDSVWNLLAVPGEKVELILKCNLS